MCAQPPLVVVDTANVVGSVPDGWWRDRLGEAERLRDSLAPLADRGLPGHLDGPVELVMVVEGAARTLAPVEGVRVVPAAGSADDRIVRLVAEEGRDRVCLVVTADRGLRRRLAPLGAVCTGPRAVRHGRDMAEGPGPRSEVEHAEAPEPDAPVQRAEPTPTHDRRPEDTGEAPHDGPTAAG